MKTVKLAYYKGIGKYTPNNLVLEASEFTEQSPDYIRLSDIVEVTFTKRTDSADVVRKHEQMMKELADEYSRDLEAKEKLLDQLIKELC